MIIRGKRSARCQFYIVQNPQGIHRLDGDYTVFGHVIKGMDIVDQVVNVARNQADEPETPITLKIEIIYLNEIEYSNLINQPKK